LALFTIIVLFVLSSVIPYLVGVLVFDNPRPELEALSARSHIFAQSAVLFGIGLVVLLILSSIAIIVSTKVSSGATIGITTAIAIFIPITGFIGTFVSSEPYVRPIKLMNAKNTNSSQLNGIQKAITDIFKNVKLPAPSLKQLLFLTKVFNDYSQETLKMYTNKDYGLGRIALNNDESDIYKYLSFVDLNYQLGQLGKIAVDASLGKSSVSDEDIVLLSGKNPRLIKMPYTLKAKINATEVDAIFSKSEVENNA
jgi:hypothetical protein